MFGLAVGTDLSALRGCTLESFSLSQHQVQLRFDSLNRISVSVEANFAVIDADATACLYEHVPDAAAALAALLDVQIVDALVATPGTVTLRFATGTTIEIYDSSQHYESYQIYIGDRVIVV